MSRAHIRKPIDFTKPLIKVESSEQFYKTEIQEQNDNNQTNPSNGDLKPDIVQFQSKKSNIIIPTVKELPGGPKTQGNAPQNYLDEKMLKKRKNQLQYIRTSYKVVLPSNSKYEATDKDLNFLKEINIKLEQKGVTARFSQEKFEKVIEIWEEKVNKEDILPFSALQTCISSEFRENEQILKDYLQDIYTYWKSLREQYRRPILRKYWKAINKDDSNPNTVFRIRENPKMKTRRSQRANEPENLEKMKLLKNNLDVAQTLISNITYRELVKLELMELNIIKFEQSIQDKADQVSISQMLNKYKQLYETEPQLTFKNKLKEFNKTAQRLLNNYRDDNKVVLEVPKPTKILHKNIIFRTGHTVPIQSNEDINFDLASFIASIAEECFAKDITLQKVQNIDFPSISAPAEVIPPAPINIPTPAEKSIEASEKIPSSRKIQNVIEIPKAMPIEPQAQPINKEIPRQKVSLIISPPIVEEKNILRYKLQKRIGRQGRIYIDKIFAEDEFMAINFDNERNNKLLGGLRPSLMPSEIIEKIPHKELHDIYSHKFKKYQEMYPFADSEDDNDLVEYSKSLKKNISIAYKNFIKQRRSTTSFISSNY